MTRTRLRVLREGVGVSQVRFGQKLGVAPGLISDLECRRRAAWPRLRRRIARFFSVAEAEVFEPNGLARMVEDARDEEAGVRP